jgi:hypothetical protein
VGEGEAEASEAKMWIDTVAIGPGPTRKDESCIVKKNIL